LPLLPVDRIRYIGELVQQSEGTLLRTPNFGRKSVVELKDVLTAVPARDPDCCRPSRPLP